MGGYFNSRTKDTKKGQMIIEYHLTYKAPLVGYRLTAFGMI
jgi:hypothetical protein